MRYSMDATRLGSRLSVVGVFLWLLSCDGAGEKELKPSPLQQAVSAQNRGLYSERSRIVAWAAERNYPESDVVDKIVVGNKEFDCVPFESQIAVRGTGLTMDQVIPPPEPEISAVHVDSNLLRDTAKVRAREKQGERGCPAGTVRIHRYSERELARFRTLEEVKKHYEITPHIVQCDLASPQRYYEIYGSEFGSPERGAHTTLDVNVNVQVASVHTIGQMWLAVNRHPCTTPMPSTVETIESGWIKRPGDNVEMFVFYTPDGYQTYCFNSSCYWSMSSFVRVGNSGITPGAEFTNNGTLEMAWHLYKPGAGVNPPGWWYYANGWVGYYDLAQFNDGMQDGVTLIAAGGEIGVSSGNQMGNGQWGDSANASYVADFWSLGWDHYYYYMPNATYWGNGRYDSSSNGKYYVDGREIQSWHVTGTYSIPISDNRSFFRYGGPGPGSY